MWRHGPVGIGAAAGRSLRVGRRSIVPPFKGVVTVKARQEIIAEIRVETFVIEVRIAIAATLHGSERRWRNLRRRAIIIDPWIAGWVLSPGRCQVTVRDFRTNGTIQDGRSAQHDDQPKPSCHGLPPDQRGGRSRSAYGQFYFFIITVAVACFNTKAVNLLRPSERRPAGSSPKPVPEKAAAPR